MNATIEYEWEDENCTLTFRIQGYLTPEIPGRYKGLPEDCYPTEGRSLQNWTFELIDGFIFDDEGMVIREFKNFTDEDKLSARQAFDNALQFGNDLHELIEDRMCHQ